MHFLCKVCVAETIQTWSVLGQGKPRVWFGMPLYNLIMIRILLLIHAIMLMHEAEEEQRREEDCLLVEHGCK